MIDGDNRGERCLAYPQAPSSVLRTLSRRSGCTNVAGRLSPALASAAKSTQASQRGCTQTKAWKRGEMLSSVTGPPFCNPGSCMPSSAGGIRTLRIKTSEVSFMQRSREWATFVLVDGGLPCGSKTSLSVQRRVRGFATLAVLTDVAGVVSTDEQVTKA
jgi:hypothetical protein